MTAVATSPIDKAAQQVQSLGIVKDIQGGATKVGLAKLATWLGNWIRTAEGSITDKLKALTQTDESGKNIFLAQTFGDSLTPNLKAVVEPLLITTVNNIRTSLELCGGIDPLTQTYGTLYAGALDVKQQKSHSQEVADQLGSLATDKTYTKLGSEKIQGETDKHQAIMKGTLLEAIKLYKESQSTNKPQTLAEIIKTNFNGHFTTEFLQEQRKIFQLNADTVEITGPLNRGGETLKAILEHGSALDFSIIQKELAEKPRKGLLQAIGQFFSQIKGLDDPNMIKVQLDNFKQKEPDAYKLLILQAKKTDMINKTRDPLQQLMNKFTNIDQASVVSFITTAVIGYLGGGLLGMPGMGAILAGILSIVSGSETSDKKTEASGNLPKPAPLTKRADSETLSQNAA